MGKLRERRNTAYTEQEQAELDMILSELGMGWTEGVRYAIRSVGRAKLLGELSLTNKVLVIEDAVRRFVNCMNDAFSEFTQSMREAERLDEEEDAKDMERIRDEIRAEVDNDE